MRSLDEQVQEIKSDTLSIAAELKTAEVDGILMDLGVSTHQLLSDERGFGFQSAAPLDMRMNRLEKLTAAELVNRLPEKELADLLYRLGEEYRSRAVARAIVRARPIHTPRTRGRSRSRCRCACPGRVTR